MTVLGFIGAGLMSFQSLKDWNESPLLTTIQSIDVPITDLIFPSVTVCQGKKGNKITLTYLLNKA